MSNLETPSDTREFRCIHCDGKIQIPKDLPPTTGPCPHCQGIITSTVPDAAEPAPEIVLPAPEIVLPAPEIVLPAPEPIASKPPESVSAKQEPPVSTPAVPVVPTAPPKEIPPPKTPIPPRKIPDPVKYEVPAPAESIQMQAPEPSGPRRVSWLIPGILLLLVLILGAYVAVTYFPKGLIINTPPPVVAEKAVELSASDAQYIRVGWQKEARQVLRDFMAASSSKEKLPFVLNSNSLSSQIESFYASGGINDSDTPAEAFTIYDLSLADHKRGLFRMIYDQAPKPASAAQAGTDEAVNPVMNTETPTVEPVRVHAYFKRTPDGLKLDWEVFAQTKYRTLQRFVKLPKIGQLGVFRIFVVEDESDNSRIGEGIRTYRVFDTANPLDFAKINVKVASEIGRALSVINWREIKGGRPTTQTATVELKWTGEESAPELEISRFICWEFLGLGGQEAPAAKTGK